MRSRLQKKVLFAGGVPAQQRQRSALTWHFKDQQT